MSTPITTTDGVCSPVGDRRTLRALCSQPADLAAEPEASFPLAWYEHFLEEIVRLGLEVITYRDLFAASDDWNYRSHYAREFDLWQRHERDPATRYLLIQHDVDNHPDFTRRMVALEALYGIRSNVFLFHTRWSTRGPAPYEVDHAFFQRAERCGWVIGYHQNAFALAGFDMDAALERYRRDVAALRQLYRIDFVVPHGGQGLVRDGKTIGNADVPMPPELQGNLRWVYNGYGARFADRWSDGGLRKVRQPDRLRALDLVGRFLRNLRPGTRNFCLVHPQRWGFNVNPDLNPLLARQPWYRDMCRRYAPAATAAAISTPTR